MSMLSDISRTELEEYVFPGTDAAVLEIEQKLPQQELEEIFSELSGQHRFYPTDTGWEIKFPYWYAAELLKSEHSGFPKKNFRREKLGWDHEHCSFCHEHIHIGQLSYTADHEEGGVYIICLRCTEKCK